MGIIIFLYASHLFYESFRNEKDIDKVKKKIEIFFALGWVLVCLNLAFIIIDFVKMIIMIGIGLYKAIKKFIRKKRKKK